MIGFKVRIKKSYSNSEEKLDKPETERLPKGPKEDMSIPPSFTPTFFRMLAKNARKFGVTRAKLAMDALRYYVQAKEKKQSPFTKAIGSEELAEKFTEANRKIAKKWWTTISEEEKRERALKAIRARWAKSKEEKPKP